MARVEGLCQVTPLFPPLPRFTLVMLLMRIVSAFRVAFMDKQHTASPRKQS